MWTSKIEHAKRHMEILKQELNVFLASKPFDVDTKVEPVTGRLIYYISKVEEVPQQLPLIAGDVVQNLRSSLDHLAYDLVTKNAGAKVAGRHTYFPIAKTKAEYEREKRRKTAGISKADLALIDSVRPYADAGGNEALWQLHALNNLDKHRLLVTVGGSYNAVDIGGLINRDMGMSIGLARLPKISLFIRPADSLFPLKMGDELFSDQPGAKPNPDVRFNIGVVLSEPGILRETGLTETLQSMIEAVEAIKPLFAIPDSRRLL